MSHQQAFVYACHARKYGQLVYTYTALRAAMDHFDKNPSVIPGWVAHEELRVFNENRAALISAKGSLMCIDLELTQEWLKLRTRLDVDKDGRTPLHTLHNHRLIAQLDRFFQAPYVGITVDELMEEKGWRLKCILEKAIPESFPYQYGELPKTGGWTTF